MFKASELDDDFYDELEETLVMSDMGYETTERIVEDLKARVKEEHIKEAQAVPGSGNQYYTGSDAGG